MRGSQCVIVEPDCERYFGGPNGTSFPEFTCLSNSQFLHHSFKAGQYSHSVPVSASQRERARNGMSERLVLFARKFNVKARHNDRHSAKIRDFKFYCCLFRYRSDVNRWFPFSVKLFSIQLELLAPYPHSVARRLCIASRYDD